VEKRGGSFNHIAKIGKYIPNEFDFLVNRWLGPNINITARK
jgi:hypothetical protein